ncbi:MAG: radical SAM protein [bacterium]|nr:radical SAM protein [bacterium]
MLGGYHATLAYDEISKSSDVEVFDFIIRGEGELTFKELLQVLKNEEKDFIKIKGLSYKQNGKFIHNEPRDLTDLMRIKLPDRKVRILNNFYMWGIPGDVVETSRGCTMSCKFCCITQMYGRIYRTYPIKRVVEDIVKAKEAGAKYIFFADDNITLNVKRFENLLDAIIEARLNDIRYATQASCEGIGSSERLVEKMKEAGFDTVFLGVENVVKENLEYLGKGEIVSKSIKTIQYLQKYKIIILIGIIAGNPDDTPEKIRANLNALKKLKCYAYQRFVLTPHIGTKIREELLTDVPTRG